MAYAIPCSTSPLVCNLSISISRLYITCPFPNVYLVFPCANPHDCPSICCGPICRSRDTCLAGQHDDTRRVHDDRLVLQ